MSDESDENRNGETIKVIDRRRFDESGVSKTGEEQKETVRASASPIAEKKSEKKEIPLEKQQFDESGLPSVDFPSFVMSLATQAMILLGEIPNPESNQLAINMPAARQTIDILALLEEKTKGNLSSEEQGLMSEVVASLQMAFVKKSGRK